MSSGVFDSMIVIDALNGIQGATAALEAAESPAISVVTWIEVMLGFRESAFEAEGRRFLTGFDLVPLSEGVAEEAVRIRRERRLKLPDAIILATSRHLGLPLLTRNTKDFDPGDPMIRVPYTV
ncbi:MAG: type II toxin-antitoxin system VapC family toxin [Dehalococcoidia bacterium]